LETSSNAKERNSAYIMDGSSVEMQVALAGGGLVSLAQPGEENGQVSPLEAATR
jgi:hypothetical protein